MKRIAPLSSLCMAIALFVSGCVSRSSGYWRWESVGKEGDTVVSRLQRAYVAGGPVGRIASLTDSLGALAAAGGRHATALTTRWWFFKAKLHFHESQPDSFARCIDRAFATADSAARPYEYNRLKSMVLVADEQRGIWDLGAILRSHDFYRSVGDDPMAAQMIMLASNAMCEAGMHRKALDYYAVGDSLLKNAGQGASRRVYSINYWSMLAHGGRHAEAAALLDTLLADPTVTSDIQMHNTLLRNAYVYTNEPSFLDEARRQARSDPRLSYLRPLYDGLKARDWLRSGQTDSARMCRDIFLPAVDSVGNLFTSARLCGIVADIFEEEEDWEGACKWRSEYVARMDSAYAASGLEGNYSVQANRELAVWDLERKALKTRNMLWLAGGILVLVLSGGTAWVLWSRQRQRMRLANVEAELRMERQSRKLSAAALSLEETRGLGNDIMETMREMRRSGTVGGAAERQVETVVNRHSRRLEDIGRFSEVVTEVHPRFASNLKAACPDLAETQLQLASYIMIGMVNKDIAVLLKVRPESVRQAKWRLKQRLGLPDGVTLEDALRAYNA